MTVCSTSTSVGNYFLSSVCALCHSVTGRSCWVQTSCISNAQILCWGARTLGAHWFAYFLCSFIITLRLLLQTEKRLLDFTYIDWNCDCDALNETMAQTQYFSKYGIARKRAPFGYVPLSELLSLHRLNPFRSVQSIGASTICLQTTPSRSLNFLIRAIIQNKAQPCWSKSHRVKAWTGSELYKRDLSMLAAIASHQKEVILLLFTPKILFIRVGYQINTSITSDVRCVLESSLSWQTAVSVRTVWFFFFFFRHFQLFPVSLMLSQKICL